MHWAWKNSSLFELLRRQDKLATHSRFLNRVVLAAALNTVDELKYRSHWRQTHLSQIHHGGNSSFGQQPFIRYFISSFPPKSPHFTPPHLPLFLFFFPLYSFPSPRRHLLYSVYTQREIERDRSCLCVICCCSGSLLSFFVFTTYVAENVVDWQTSAWLTGRLILRGNSFLFFCLKESILVPDDFLLVSPPNHVKMFRFTIFLFFHFSIFLCVSDHFGWWSDLSVS